MVSHVGLGMGFTSDDWPSTRFYTGYLRSLPVLSPEDVLSLFHQYQKHFTERIYLYFHMNGDIIPRRRFVASAMAIVTAGCIGGDVDSKPQTSVETTTEAECEINFGNVTDQAIREYRTLIDEFSSVHILMGWKEDMQVDAVFGSQSGLGYLACGRDEDNCETAFLNAVEQFQSAKDDVQELRKDFEQLQENARTCDVEEQQLFEEQTTNGIEKAKAYVPAIDSFIESAKHHVDEDLDSFQQDNHFREGMRKYKETRGMEMMDADLFEQKVEVYNG